MIESAVCSIRSNVFHCCVSVHTSRRKLFSCHRSNTARHTFSTCLCHDTSPGMHESYQLDIIPEDSIQFFVPDLYRGLPLRSLLFLERQFTTIYSSKFNDQNFHCCITFTLTDLNDSCVTTVTICVFRSDLVEHLATISTSFVFFFFQPLCS